jgi:ectoine hydroxylase-related dioxygenase (phytanoyl-CoA dioxygenase family)
MNLSYFNRQFAAKGYCIVNLLSKNQINKIKKIVISKIKKLSNKSKYLDNFNYKKMHNYHLLNIPGKEHKKILKTSSRYVMLDKLITNVISKNKHINSIMHSNWGHNSFIINWVGSLKKRQIKRRAIGFRIARPSKVRAKDATSIHCDLHVGGKICNDKNVLITAWLPLVGFNKKYSLRFAPKSHLSDHPTSGFTKSKIVSNIFSKSYYRSFKFFRPTLKKGQAIIFHPNLLHGNSYNLGNVTRFSVEIRFYNKKNIKNWLN